MLNKTRKKYVAGHVGTRTIWRPLSHRIPDRKEPPSAASRTREAMDAMLSAPHWWLLDSDCSSTSADTLGTKLTKERPTMLTIDCVNRTAPTYIMATNRNDVGASEENAKNAGNTGRQVAQYHSRKIWCDGFGQTYPRLTKSRVLWKWICDMMYVIKDEAKFGELKGF